jgi:hypothetical protein
MMRWTRHAAQIGKKKKHMLLVPKAEVNRPLRKPRRNFVDNIKIDFGETGCSGVKWIELVTDRD